MSDEPNTFPLDHNNPPNLLVGDELSEHLETAYAEDVNRTEELLDKGQKYLVIASDEEDAAATEFMVAVRARWKASEANRVAEKAPYDDNAGRVQGFFKTKVLDLLGLAPSDPRASFDPEARTDLGLGPRINMAQTLYKRRKAEEERKRLAAEAAAKAEQERIAKAAALKAENDAREAERVAARKRTEESRATAEAEATRLRTEADAARQVENRAAEERASAQTAAAAPAADLSRARGGRGGVSSLRTFLDFRDLDRDVIAGHPLTVAKLMPYIDDTALSKAVKGWIDANKGAASTAAKGGDQPLAGVVIFENSKNAGRA